MQMNIGVAVCLSRAVAPASTVAGYTEQSFQSGMMTNQYSSSRSSNSQSCKSRKAGAQWPHHHTELQSLRATGKGSQEGALFSSTLIPIPVFEQLTACIVALGGGQLPMHVVLRHDVMVAINGTEDQGDRRQRLGPAGLAVAERV